MLVFNLIHWCKFYFPLFLEGGLLWLSMKISLKQRYKIKTKSKIKQHHMQSITILI